MVISRKALIIVSIITITLLGIFFGWRPVLVAMFTPGDVFEAERSPPALDYSNENSWIAHPAKQSAALLSPPGVESIDQTNRPLKAAVFYVHPTTYFADNAWNWSPDPASHAQQGIEHTLATQASVFNNCCDIYAPYYRQAHLASFGAGTDASLQALDLAYEDVAQAYEQFLLEIGPQAPFFLAGHSQGSAHLQRLVSQKIDGQPEHDRLIAAYMIGYWLPVDVSARSFPDVPICNAADATGCVVTWDAYDRGAETLPFISVPHWLIDGWDRLEEGVTACVNPLSWLTDNDHVEKATNLGAIEAKPAGNLVDIILDRNPGVTYEALGPALPNATSAECDDSGKLLTDTQFDNEFQRSGHGDSGSYHAFDWNLFYFNIRQNVSVRLQAYSLATGILAE